MSKEGQPDPTSRRHRRKRGVPHAIRHAKAIVASHAASAAFGGISGLAVGALSGAIAGQGGAVAGALLGGAIGAAAGAAIGAGEQQQRNHDASLDFLVEDVVREVDGSIRLRSESDPALDAPPFRTSSR